MGVGQLKQVKSLKFTLRVAATEPTSRLVRMAVAASRVSGRSKTPTLPSTLDYLSRAVPIDVVVSYASDQHHA